MSLSFTDDEFGEIMIRKHVRARSISMRLGTDGRFVVSAPKFTPTTVIKLTISNSRQALRQLAAQVPRPEHYVDGQAIGKHHKLAVVPTSMVSAPTASTTRQRLIVQLPPDRTLEESAVQQLIRDEVTAILRREAKAYLPGRLADMARKHGFSYTTVRFSHSGGRWGSCSSSGTISLNIALLKLPDDIIDYVLAHELSHTRQMNHSTAFWKEVATIDPLYKLHRQQLKRESPVV